MGKHTQQDMGNGNTPPLTLRRLLPSGDPAAVEQLLEEWGLWERPAADGAPPRVMLNMVSSVDGRATVEGRSAPLSNPADRALFHGLRSTVDAVLMGASTARLERYGRIIPDEARRRMRTERGLAEEPLACIVSNSLALELVPVLGEAAARVAILTSSAASLAPAAAQVDYIRSPPGGPLDLREAVRELRERFAVATLLCEGGPHLACELLLSLSPTLAGGPRSGGEALRILAGVDLDPPVALELLGALESDSSLFLRYGVSA
jgi:riboflavin biosynthesis pyrimidine reductase